MVLNKLKSNGFKSLRENGKTFKTSNFLFVYSLSETNLESKNSISFGCTITRKVGKAFLRNRLRRLLKEALRFYVSDEKNFSSKEHKIKLDLNIVVLQKKPENLAYSNVQEQVQSFFKNRVSF